MSTLDMIGIKGAQRRNLRRMSPGLLYIGLVALSLGIIGALSVISLTI